jgi:cobalt-precorrin-6B (C15)-methyltransferase
MKLPGTQTQPEIIDIALGKLNIMPGMVFLDAGCGSGAVSLAASRCTERIYGIDKRPEAIEASRVRVPSGIFLHGEIIDRVKEIPKIDRCFIGGSAGIEEFLPAIIENASRDCRIVVNMVRIGACARAMGLMKEVCTLEETLQIGISKGYSLAGDLALRPNNPVFMLVGRL